MNANMYQIVLALLLVALLFALTDPFMYWMPEAMLMSVLVVASALMAIWVGMMARERGGDERDLYHRTIAGRVGYAAGIITLTIALLVQGFTHTLTLWVPLTLGVMVLAKLSARLYSDRYF